MLPILILILLVLLFIALTVISYIYTYRKTKSSRRKSKKFYKPWKMILIHTILILLCNFISLYALPSVTQPFFHLIGCFIIPIYLLIFQPFA